VGGNSKQEKVKKKKKSGFLIMNKPSVGLTLKLTYVKQFQGRPAKALRPELQ
jgi:hypothetical protein